MLVQTRLDRGFNQDNVPPARRRKFTVVVPTNGAWEKAQANFNKAYNTLREGQFPQYVSTYIYNDFVK